MAYSDEVLADNPKIYWRLNEPSGTSAADSSGNGFTGTHSGGPTLGVTGLSGDGDTAAQYDRNSPAKSTVSGTVYPPSTNIPTWSIEVLIKPTSVPLGGTIQQIWGSASATISINLFEDRVFVSPNLVGGSFVTTAGDPTITAGTTYHIVADYDGTTYTIYVDGVARATKTASGGVTSQGTNATFRVGDTSTTFNFDGVVDEAAFYDHALGPTRIAAHYNALSGGGGTDATATPTAIVSVVTVPSATVDAEPDTPDDPDPTPEPPDGPTGAEPGSPAGKLTSIEEVPFLTGVQVMDGAMGPHNPYGDPDKIFVVHFGATGLPFSWRILSIDFAEQDIVTEVEIPTMVHSGTDHSTAEWVDRPGQMQVIDGSPYTWFRSSILFGHFDVPFAETWQILTCTDETLNDLEFIVLENATSAGNSQFRHPSLEYDSERLWLQHRLDPITLNGATSFGGWVTYGFDGTRVAEIHQETGTAGDIQPFLWAFAPDRTHIYAVRHKFPEDPFPWEGDKWLMYGTIDDWSVGEWDPDDPHIIFKTSDVPEIDSRIEGIRVNHQTGDVFLWVWEIEGPWFNGMKIVRLSSEGEYIESYLPTQTQFEHDTDFSGGSGFAVVGGTIIVSAYFASTDGVEEIADGLWFIDIESGEGADDPAIRLGYPGGGDDPYFSSVITSLAASGGDVIRGDAQAGPQLGRLLTVEESTRLNR